MGIKISEVEYYIPTNRVSNSDIESQSGYLTAEKIEQKIGIKNRFVADSDETALNLATKACLNLFQRGVDSQSIDALILCTQSPEYFLPTTACILQNVIGLRINTFCLDFNLGCSGYIYGLAIAKGLINIGVARNVLFVTAETYSKYISNDDFSNKCLFGDAATATLITLDAEESIQNFIFGTDGKGFQNLIVKNGASRHLNEQRPSIFFMNGPEIFTFTNKSVPLLVDETLKINNLLLEDIDYFIFHQANKYMLEHLRSKIGIPVEKFLVDLENYGNTVSNTIPIVLSNKLKNNPQFFNGKIIMLVGFGVGYSWGATVMKINI